VAGTPQIRRRGGGRVHAGDCQYIEPDSHVTLDMVCLIEGFFATSLKLMGFPAINRLRRTTHGLFIGRWLVPGGGLPL
jgi:hypothetical protein